MTLETMTHYCNSQIGLCIFHDYLNLYDMLLEKIIQ